MAESDQHYYGNWLRNVLEDVVDVHKNDMSELTSGHLNESKLWNPTTQIREPWASGRKPALRLKEPSTLKDHSVRRSYLPPIERNKRYMTDAVVDFMIGPSGGLGGQEKKRVTAPSIPTNELSFIDKEKKIPSDNNLIQELDLPHLMLPVYKKTANKNTKEPYAVRHEFIASHHTMPTKVDQLKKMRDFKDHIISKQDAEKSKMLPSAKEILGIERKLKKQLSSLEARHIVMAVPSFYKLQAYSDCWDGLINRSEIFGNAMRMIKDEYEKYISLLLDIQENQNDGLLGKIDLLCEEATCLADKVKREQKEIDDLEKQVLKILDENERLRNEKIEHERRKERSIFTLPDRSKIDQKSYRSSAKKKNLEEQVEDLHTQIDNQLKLLEGLQTERSEKYVPMIVCQRLENCMKETELEIQKLLKQNDFLEKKIDNMEEELEGLLDESGASERDARMLWMKINTSKVVDTRTTQETS